MALSPRRSIPDERLAGKHDQNCKLSHHVLACLAELFDVELQLCFHANPLGATGMRQGRDRTCSHHLSCIPEV